MIQHGLSKSMLSKNLDGTIKNEHNLNFNGQNDYRFLSQVNKFKKNDNYASSKDV